MSRPAAGRKRLHPARLIRRRRGRRSPLPVLHDGRLTLALLAAYAEEFDQLSGRGRYRAADFVAFLELEHRARPLVADMQRRATQVGPDASWPPQGGAAPVITADSGG